MHGTLGTTQKRLRQAREDAGHASASAAAEALGVKPSTYLGHEIWQQGHSPCHGGAVRSRTRVRRIVDFVWRTLCTGKSSACPSGAGGGGLG